jgi:hypothetical protein
MINKCDKIQSPRQMRPIGTTRRSVSGIYAFRGETAIPFESTLERDFIIRKEFSLSVLEIIPQPVQIPFVARNGQSYIYTPDFLVYYRLGNMVYGEYPKPILVEVKPQAEWKQHWREWLPKWKAAYRYAKEQGWEFHIHDESRIRDQALQNIRFLDRYKRTQFPIEETQCVIESVRQMGGAPFHYVLAKHFMGIYKAEGVAHIWHLLATRKLDCDISLPLNDFTELWVSTYE